jgi:hypothetical protein
VSLLDGGNDENQQYYGTYNFYNKKAQLQIEIQVDALKITTWRNMGKKEKTSKSYDVWVKQTYFWSNKRLPTSKFVACVLSSKSTKIEENCIFKGFLNKIYSGAYTK